MKKVVLFLVSLFIVLGVNADILIEVPYEDQCAKSIITDESRKKYENCVKNCEETSPLPVYCHRDCGGGPEICLYTNGERDNQLKEQTEKKDFFKKNLLYISYASIFLVLLFIISLIKNKFKNK